MKSILSMISRRFYISDVINHTDKTLSQYGQLIIAIIALGIFAYGYVVLQGMVLDYFEAIDVSSLTLN